MPAQSPNFLLRSGSKRRRLTTLNIGAMLIVVGLVGAIVFAIMWGVSSMNAKPDAGGIVNGGPQTTQAAQPQELGMRPAGYQPPYQDSVVTVQQPAPQRLVRPIPSATPQLFQQAPAASSGGGGGGYSGQSEAGSQASSQRREAQQRVVDAERDAAAKQEARTDAAMRSLGGVTVAVPHDEPQTVALASTDQRESAVPAGPILALDTSIPVELTRSIDSTFSGQFPLDVTADVLDETEKAVVLPRGTRCFATSSQGGVEGQGRIFGSVSLCKLPDRRRVVLDNFPLIDADGATGLKARVDDHGAGRRGHSFSALPMLAGTLIPGAASGLAMTAVAAAQPGQIGHAIPGPTLYVDASAQKPRTLSILVSKDTPISIGAKP